jgi:hypothetical protein
MQSSWIWEIIRDQLLQSDGEQQQEEQQQDRGRVICPGLSPEVIPQAAVLQQVRIISLCQ